MHIGKYIRSDSIITVLSGAGLSTDSGIPDYRGESGKRRPSKPLTLKEFLGSEEYRRYYWARSALGWPWFRARQPNASHQILAKLEAAEHINGIITQNVDDLHFKAGSRNVIELHGNLKQVYCLDCGRSEDREHLQQRMMDANPGWQERMSVMAADGDAHVSMEESASFIMPKCTYCGGTLKPDVVFFGESTEKTRVQRAFDLVEQCDALLVLGSSLTVRSGLRFADRARKLGKPVIIVNKGETRADQYATAKYDAELKPWLEDLSSVLLGENDS